MLPCWCGALKSRESLERSRRCTCRAGRVVWWVSSEAETLLARAVLAALLDDRVALRRLQQAMCDFEAVAAPSSAPAYTVGSLAAALEVTPRVVGNAITRGELRAVKRGARWLIPPDAVIEWTHGEATAGFRRPRTPAPGAAHLFKDTFDRLGAA